MGFMTPVNFLTPTHGSESKPRKDRDEERKIKNNISCNIGARCWS